MLSFLRKSVYDGSIPKPKPKPLPPHQAPLSFFFLKESQLDDDRTRRFASRGKKVEEPLWPTPKTRYSHTSSCFHNPSVKFNTKVEISQANQENQAGHHHPSVKILVDMEVLKKFEGELQEEIKRLEQEVKVRRETRFAVEKEYHITPVKEAGHIHDHGVEAKIRFCEKIDQLAASVLRNGDHDNETDTLNTVMKEMTKHMNSLDPRSAQQENNSILDLDHKATLTANGRITQINQELRSSRLAKCIFFRRCNGEYINAFGRIWSDVHVGAEGVGSGGGGGRVEYRRLLIRERMKVDNGGGGGGGVGGDDEGDDLILTSWAWHQSSK